MKNFVFKKEILPRDMLIIQIQSTQKMYIFLMGIYIYIFVSDLLCYVELNNTDNNASVETPHKQDNKIWNNHEKFRITLTVNFYFCSYALLSIQL